MEKTELLHLLVISILGLFLVKAHALESLAQSNTMLEQQNNTLKWIKTLKESVLQSTEPYIETAQKLRSETPEKLRDFEHQCGCSSAQNHLPDTTPHPTEDVLNITSLSSLKSNSPVTLYVFVSLSMPKQALMALNQEATHLGATLVLRGLKDNNYQKTTLYLQEIIAKTGQGFLIHPELFKRYEIYQVPSVVLSMNSLNDKNDNNTTNNNTNNHNKPIFDVVGGHIPIRTALLKMANTGELKNEAKALLQRSRDAD